jgi:GLPGLI family protein
MKIPFFLFFFNISFILVICGQNTLNKVVYDCKTQIVKGKQHDGKNTLYFDNEKSLFVHDDWPKRDSDYMIGNSFFFVKGDTSGMPVYINRKDKVLYYKTDYKSSNRRPSIMLQEDIPNIIWQIQAENTLKIGNLNCIKAFGTFGNRIYDVWFTPDIPVSFGPYKLGGLPGLILEAKSRDGKISYTFVSYESNISHPIDIIRPKKFMTFIQFKSYVINDLLETEALSDASGTVTNDDPPSEYEIEKDKITIHRDYKRARALKKNRD